MFGWEAAAVGTNYALTVPSGARVITGDGNLTFYVEVNDVEQTLRAAARLGGQSIAGTVSAPRGRSATVLRDPEGHVVEPVPSPWSV